MFSQCIYVTGGSSLIPGFKDRLHKELTALLPFREPFQIVTPYPADTRLEPWKGMAAWSRTAEAKKAAVTRAEWSEKGGDYLKEHSWGNWSDERHSAS
jgi:actin-related protein 5